MCAYVCVRKCGMGRREFATDAHVLFMKVRRICAIKALSNIKQNRGQQSKENGEKKKQPG